VLVQHASGPFGGSFILEDPAQGGVNYQVKEERVVFAVTEGTNASGGSSSSTPALRVEATGNNFIGLFVLRGSLNAATGQLSAEKLYLSQPAAAASKQGESSPMVGCLGGWAARLMGLCGCVRACVCLRVRACVCVDRRVVARLTLFPPSAPTLGHRALLPLDTPHLPSRCTCEAR
jgi:hypothetical protein